MTRLGYVPSDAPVDGIGEERHVEEDDPYLESDEDEVSDGGLMRIRLVMGVWGEAGRQVREEGKKRRQGRRRRV